MAAHQADVAMKRRCRRCVASENVAASAKILCEFDVMLDAG
jgi:hypothetical protein